eukprot:CAMPEP_0196683190 /NCGR_PEP_ID=MMETSP1090-20130531/9729_1 /TAXON_ID=37098 /ORGANISM="Isochrysis sp, Strain CCMP1244" /LENGTH=96 /DNA_ID=CAMNT_0042021625 /DNA_START=105 /DNA_END=393 /DNA_ORIENTATION=-
MLCGVTRAPRECEGDESGGTQLNTCPLERWLGYKSTHSALGEGTRLREQPARVAARQRLLEVDRRSAAAAAPPLASPPLLQAAPVHAVWRDGVYHE